MDNLTAYELGRTLGVLNERQNNNIAVTAKAEVLNRNLRTEGFERRQFNAGFLSAMCKEPPRAAPISFWAGYRFGQLENILTLHTPMRFAEALEDYIKFQSDLLRDSAEQIKFTREVRMRFNSNSFSDDSDEEDPDEEKEADTAESVHGTVAL